jgi:DNA-binding helix-hairpin-helix protein with protein kinase domain
LAALVLWSSSLGHPLGCLQAGAQNARATHGHYVGHPQMNREPYEPAPVSIPPDDTMSPQALAWFEREPRGVGSAHEVNPWPAGHDKLSRITKGPFGTT